MSQNTGGAEALSILSSGKVTNHVMQHAAEGTLKVEPGSERFANLFHTLVNAINSIQHYLEWNVVTPEDVQIALSNFWNKQEEETIVLKERVIRQLIARVVNKQMQEILEKSIK